MYGRVGYASPFDTNPFIPGTQLSPFDADPFTPGIQLAGTPNYIPHYSSPIDTNPFLAGTQVGPVTLGGCYGGFGVNETVTTTTTYGPAYGGFFF